MDGAYNKLVRDLETEDPEWYFDYLRMTPEQFKYILSLVRARIAKQDTNWRRAISEEERLALTIRHMATGESKRSLSYQYLIGRSTVTKIIAETAEAIWVTLKDHYMKSPSVSDYQKIAERFQLRWNFPNCLGGIDGKHIRVKCPSNSGSKFFCYKKFFSIILMAVADSNYKFILIDVGAEGSAGDSGVFGRSSFGRAIMNDRMPIPGPKAIPSGIPMPHVFVADEAFPLRANIMRPFPGGLGILDRQKRIYNYRMSRARLVIENAFGIMAARWRIFHTPMDSKLETVDSIIKACCCLHNYLMKENSEYCPRSFIDVQQRNGDLTPGAWRTTVPQDWLQRLSQQGSNNHSGLAVQIREKFAEYFNSSTGALPWQNEYLFS